jgi:hypothetical protein
VESTASWCCSKSMDTIPTTIRVYMIDINEYWYRMEYLLYLLGVIDNSEYRQKLHSRLGAFYNAATRHTGISNPYYTQGRAVDYHDF